MSFLNPFFRNHFIYSNPEFLKPYLIQIVKKPLNLLEFNSKQDWLLNSFKFGGKTHEFGGFDISRLEDIASIMSFKGMGSSQYEWGSVPGCFDYFYYHDFTNFSFILKDYPVEVFVICNKIHVKKIKNYINKLSICSDWLDLKKNKCSNLRDMPYFKQSVQNFYEKKECEFLGWLELSNPFFFFLDEKMYHDSLNLFISKSMHYILND